MPELAGSLSTAWIAADNRGLGELVEINVDRPTVVDFFRRRFVVI